MVLKLGQAAGPMGLCCPDLWVGVLPEGTPHSWESLGVHAGLLMGELRAVRPWATHWALREPQRTLKPGKARLRTPEDLIPMLSP